MSFLASLTIINTSTNVGIYGGGKAMKKSLLLALTMLFIGMFSVTGVADEPETLAEGDFRYFINDDGSVSIAGWDGDDKELNIPSEIDEKPVTVIKKRAVDWRFGLESIKIPASVTTVEDNAINGCDQLRRIWVSPKNKNYAVIDNVLFDKKNKVLIKYPTGSFDEEYVIPNGIKGIGADAFTMCYELKKVVIPDSVEFIGEGAFASCIWLKDLNIPDSVESIGADAFDSCDLLLISVSSDSRYKVANGTLFDKENKTLIHCPSDESVSKYVIPKGTITIGGGSFYGCEYLTNIEIPDSVTEIGQNAFYGCSGLSGIKIPDSVTKIGKNAFDGCSGLTGIRIPDTVTNIEEYVFSGCSRITSVEVPDSVTEIGEYAFSNCSGLTSIQLPDSIKVIRSGLFSGCDSLSGIEIPDSVTVIEEFAFVGCDYLTNIIIPDTVTKIEDYAFSGCSRLSSVEIPASVTAIGKKVFEECDEISLVVEKDSYAAQYAEENEIPYNYPDANDWLND